MRAIDWKMLCDIGIGVGIIFLAIGGWINVESYFGWSSYFQWYEYRSYGLPLVIMGIVLLVFGLAFQSKAHKSAGPTTPTTPYYTTLHSSLMRVCPNCKKRLSKDANFCPNCGTNFH